MQPKAFDHDLMVLTMTETEAQTMCITEKSNDIEVWLGEPSGAGQKAIISAKEKAGF